MATQSDASVTITGGSITGITDLAIADGGTGASTAAGALVNLGLSASAAELNRMNGISVSTAELNTVSGIASNIQGQLNAKAPITNPSFGGTVATSSLNLGGNIVTDIATQSQAENGTLHSVVMTPLRTKQAIAASTSEVLAATTGGGFAAVGTYALLGNPHSNAIGGNTIGFGDNVSGSILGRGTLFDEGGNAYMGMTVQSQMSGTWRNMGGTTSSSRDKNLSIFLRVA
jgi:hypothetical protein